MLTALLLVDDSVSLEEDDFFFDDEELEVSSLFSLLSSPFSFAFLSAFSSVSSVFVVFLHVSMLPLARLRCWQFRCYRLCLWCPLLLIL